MLFVNLMIGAFCCAVGTRFVHHIRKKVSQIIVKDLHLSHLV